MTDYLTALIFNQDDSKILMVEQDGQLFLPSGVECADKPETSEEQMADIIAAQTGLRLDAEFDLDDPTIVMARDSSLDTQIVYDADASENDLVRHGATWVDLASAVRHFNGESRKEDDSKFHPQLGVMYNDLICNALELRLHPPARTPNARDAWLQGIVDKQLREQNNNLA